MALSENAPSIITRHRGTKLWPLLTGTHRYEKTVSTRGIGQGEYINAPILAYLVETPNGRILYDVGCDYQKIANPKLNKKYFEPMKPEFDAPIMTEDQRIPHYLEKLGLNIRDIDIVFIGHLHFDHVGGICDVPGCEVHIHKDELVYAYKGLDEGIFEDELTGASDWKHQTSEYEVSPGVRAINTPGHTAGHMSLFVELSKGSPVILCGDAADLTENLEHEVAPGYCWEDNIEMAVSSIRKLKTLSTEESAVLWPNHDMAFFNNLPRFPEWID